MNAIDQLINYNKTTGLLQSVAGRNAWDQETMMPSKSGNSRAMEMGALQEVIHDRKKNPIVQNYWKKPNPKHPFKKSLYIIKRAFDRAKLYQANSHRIWLQPHP